MSDIYKNNYSTEIYVGERRSGKDLSMISDVYEIVKENKDVIIYANFWLNPKFFPITKYITQEKVLEYYKTKKEFRNSIFLISELHQFADSRNFMRGFNKAFMYFIGQLGKRKNILKGTTHFPNQIDLRLRGYCERWIYCYKGLTYNGVWEQILNTGKTLTDNENTRLTIKRDAIIRKMISYQFYEMIDTSYKQYLKAKPIFNMYDSDEVIQTDIEE